MNFLTEWIYVDKWKISPLVLINLPKTYVDNYTTKNVVQVRNLKIERFAHILEI